MKEMTLKIKNFGIINEAEINIGKINVIAGQNASGKTTSSKLFYCLLASVSPEGNYLINNSILQRLEYYLQRYYRRNDNDEVRNQIRQIRHSIRQLNKYEMFDWNIELFELLNNFIKVIDEENNLENTYNKMEFIDIEKIIEMQNSSSLMFEETLKTLLNVEFDENQISENFNESFVKMNGKNDEDFDIEISFKKGISITKNDFKGLEINEVSFVETPYILDFNCRIRTSEVVSHQQSLLRKLKDHKKDVFDSRLNENIINFQKKIEDIVEGNLKFDASLGEFIFEQNDKTFSFRNIATGIKSFGILQMLLKNRKLPEDSYLIIDEPEVHLHPEWQIKLAEIIVLLTKELNITLYINTHSPQFIEAIEVYSEFHEIRKDTNFYLTEKYKNGKFNINKIENDELQKIYRNLGDPYDDIDIIRGQNIAKKLKRGY